MLFRSANLPEVLLQYRKWGGNVTATRWHEQEEEANRVVQTNIREALDVDVSSRDVSLLRGLARDSYPTTAADLRSSAEAIGRLVPKYVDRPMTSRADRRLIERDAGVRLWLLAALAGRQSPRLSLQLAAQASRIDPLSGFAFSARALRRLAESTR